MKKIYSILTMAVLFVSGLSAQTLTGTDPMPKNAILEEYTGIHCQYCPDGHAIAKSILENNPGRAFTIAIHQGSFAAPSSGEPDYRTSFGDALAGQTGLSGYPSGTVNRHVFSGVKTALDRGAWAGSCDQIMGQTSPVNLGIASNFNPMTRELTVDVELYYTSDAPASTNFINVVLTQDSIYGPQTGGGAGNNYLHMHMLRHMITGQWGEEVNTTTAGSLVTRSYSYIVPADYNSVPAVVENMNVVVFVTESHQEIYTGYEVPAIDGTNLFIGDLTSEDQFVKKGFNGFETEYVIKANSNIDGTSDFNLSFAGKNMPADWEAIFTVDGVEYTTQAAIELTKGVEKEILVKVTPGESAGFPTMTLNLSSVDHPNAPVQLYKVMLVAGVTDLLVNGTGGPETVLHQTEYLDGLQASGITSYAVVNANEMRDMINAGASSDVFTCWLNIAWTFPALSDSQAEAIMDYLDAGGNVFIAGQDIGWDIMSGASGSNGNEITRNFYTNYLKAGFVDDGSSSNNKLNAVVEDEVFGEVPQTNIVDVYGGNMYPDVITAGEGADVIFTYATPSNVAAIRYEAPNYRSIYFGVGLEMLANTEVRNTIIGLTREWLSAEMVSVEYDDAVNALISRQNYPNPANDYTFIPVSKSAKGGLIEIYSMNGIKVLSKVIDSESLCRIELSQLPVGIYTYRIVADQKVSEARKLSIVR